MLSILSRKKYCKNRKLKEKIVVAISKLNAPKELESLLYSLTKKLQNSLDNTKDLDQKDPTNIQNVLAKLISQIVTNQAGKKDPTNIQNVLLKLISLLDTNQAGQKEPTNIQNVLLKLISQLVTNQAGQMDQEKVHKFFDLIVSDILKPTFLNAFYDDRLLTLDKSASFLDCPSFQKAMAPTSEIKSDKLDPTPSWRIHTLTWAAQQTLHLDGDFVECGTFLGDFAHAICRYLKFENVAKTFYLYDSFEGLDKRNTSMDDYHKECSGTYDFLQKYYKDNSSFELVKNKFSPYQNVTITKGFVPDSFKLCKPKKICFLHIDMNAPAAELRCIEELYDSLVPGAIVIYDDYGWKVFEKQKQVADEFAQKKGYKILELPTGQGMFIKK